ITRIDLVQVDIRSLNGKFAATRHRVARVHHQVHDDLLELGTVCANGAQIRGENSAHSDVFTDQASKHLLKILHECIEIEDLGLQNLSPTESKQLACERSRASRGVVNTFETAAIFRRRAAVQEKAAVASDYREEIVEVVRNAACQPANRFHLLR